MRKTFFVFGIMCLLAGGTELFVMLYFIDNLKNRPLTPQDLFFILGTFSSIMIGLYLMNTNKPEEND